MAFCIKNVKIVSTWGNLLPKKPAYFAEFFLLVKKTIIKSVFCKDLTGVLEKEFVRFYNSVIFSNYANRIAIPYQ